MLAHSMINLYSALVAESFEKPYGMKEKKPTANKQSKEGPRKGLDDSISSLFLHYSSLMQVHTSAIKMA